MPPWGTTTSGSGSTLGFQRFITLRQTGSSRSNLGDVAATLGGQFTDQAQVEIQLTRFYGFQNPLLEERNAAGGDVGFGRRFEWLDPLARIAFDIAQHALLAWVTKSTD